MREHQRCPNCESSDIEAVHTEWYMDYVEQVHICEECPTEFVVSYADPQITEVTTYE